MPTTTQRPTQPSVTSDAHDTVQGRLIRLTGWFDQINNSVRALLFGEMVTRSQPVMHYPSDLYHDALWIERQRPNDVLLGLSHRGYRHRHRPHSGRHT